MASLARCLAALVALVATEGPALALMIDEPAQGEFVSAADIGLSGRIATPDPAATSVLLDGSPLALRELGSLPDGFIEMGFSAPLSIDFDAVFNASRVEWTLPDGSSGRDRVTFVAGPFTLDGDASPGSAALRFNDSGLDDFEQVIEGLVDFDLEALLPVGLRIFRRCLVDTFAGCIGRARVFIDNPPPSFLSQSVALDVFSDGVQLDLRLEEVRVDLEIRGSGVVPDCELRITADAATVSARYAFAADPVDPRRIDLSESAPLQIAFDDFNRNFTGGSCSNGLIEDVINEIVGNLKGDIRDALADLLRDPDGVGPEDGPVAEEIEDTLARIEIAGPIGAAFGVDLRGPLADVLEDDTGLTLVTDTIFQAPSVGCGAPNGFLDLDASYAPPGMLPAFLATTPRAGLPYDVALAVTDAALNQGLKVFTECGLLHWDLEELELGGMVFPFSAGLLALVDPAFDSLPPDLPLTLRVRPTIAPILAAGSGPQGELAALRIADLRIAVVDPASEFTWLLLSVDATTSLDFGFAPSTRELSLTAADSLADVEILVLDNPIGANEISIPTTFGDLFERGALSLAEDLGSFGLPPLLGRELLPIEIDRTEGTATLYFEATVPEPSIAQGGAVATLLLAFLARRRNRRRLRREETACKRAGVPR